MADVEANIKVDIDTSSALASIKNLQRQISAFHSQMLSSGNAANAAMSQNMQKNLVNSINATGKFSANLTNIKSTTESFTGALEKNKLSMGEYFRYAGGSTKTFGRLFKSEFATIDKVARERVKTLQTQYIKMGRDANGALQAIKVRPLALDMQNLATQTAMAAQKQQLLNQLIKQGTTNLVNWGKNIQWAGRQLMVGFTVPLAMLGTVAAKTFMDMEKQAIRFKRVYGEMFTGSEETDKALQNVKDLAKEFTRYGVAVEKTLELAADVAQMGLTGVELTAQVTNATRLAVLGEVDQQQALKATISVTNAFGVAAEDLASKINFLNAVENQTVTAIEDLTIAIPKAGPVVKQLGGDVEDLSFFLTAMKEGGINASEGANALKSGLASLINPAQKSKDMLQELGINIDAIVEGNAGDIKGTVIGFAQALDTLDPLNRARAIEQLFGKFQFSRISTLFQNVVKEGSQAQRVLDLSRATAEELAVLAERELKKVEESPAFKFQKALEDIKTALVPLGEQFLKLLTPIVEFITGILQKFNEMGDGAKAFFTGLVAFLGLIAPAALMTIGLVANGVGNLIKGFNSLRLFYQKLSGSSSALGAATQYMTQEQLEAAAIASSLGQSHARLAQVFTSEANAIYQLIGAYQAATSAQLAMQAASVSQRIQVAPPITRVPGSRRAQSPEGTISGYSNGVVKVPGPKGAGDIIPAMLSPGEAVIPASMVKKYQPLIQSMISGDIPGYMNGVMLGMPKSSKVVAKGRVASEEIYEKFLKSSYANTPPTEYGHQISPTTGHSFPIFGLGGVYQKGDKQVFVKPVLDETVALAEMRSTEISRRAHGLEAPKQKIVVIRDPMDTTRTRRFLALESDLDPKFVNNQPMGVFNEEQYFRQLVASLVRVDKDLSASNVYGNVVADAGPAGVFSRASGVRTYEKNLPSMEEQAVINLLGIKGGAKRAFAESTLALMAGLTPEQYHQRMIAEIQKVLPKLIQTIASFNLTNPTEVGVYDDMVRRLQAGLGVNWAKFHTMHSAVTIPQPKAPKAPLKLAKGIVSVPGPKGAGDVVPAMLSPGEAVIPAKKVEKYGSLIAGIVSGNIPGYEDSNVTIKAGPTITAQAKEKLNQYESYQKGSYKKIPASVSEIDSMFPDRNLGTELANKLANAGINPDQARQIFSQANFEAEKGLENLTTFYAVIDEQIDLAKKKANGFVASSDKLVKSVRTKIPYEPASATATHFAHLGQGTKYSAQELFEKEKRGEIKPLTEKEREIISEQAKLGNNISVKSGLGMDKFDSSTNIKLAQSGVSKDEMLQAYDTAGPEKWHKSITLAGGSTEELTEDISVFDAGMRSLIANLREGTVVVDSYEEAQRRRLAGEQDVISTEELYATNRSNLSQQGKATGAIQKLDTSAGMITEYRTVRGEGPQLKSPGKNRTVKSTAPDTGLSQQYQTETAQVVNFDNAGRVVDPADLGMQDQVEYDKSGAAATTPESDPFAKSLDETKRNSPHDDAFLFGKQDQDAYNQGAESVKSSDPFASGPVSNTGAPKFDSDPFGASSTAFDQPQKQSRFSGIKSKVASIGSQENKQKLKNFAGNVGESAKETTGKIGRGIENKANEVFNNWLQSQYAAQDKEKEIYLQKKQSVQKLLLLADEEYAGLVQQDKNYMERLANTNQATDSEIQEAVARRQAIENKERLLLEELKNSDDEERVINQRLQNVRTRDAATDAELLNAKQELMSTGANGGMGGMTRKEANKQRIQRFGGRMSQVGMVASMGVGMASMIPGEAGQMAQSMAGPIMAISSLAMFIQGPWSAAIVGAIAVLGAMAFAIYSVNKAYKESQEEAIKLKNAISGSTEAIRSLSEFSGKVTAGEIADRKRQNKFRLLPVATGKTTFGESFLESDSGKALLDNLKKEQATSGGDLKSATANLTDQLSMAVVSGALTEKQAGSIAAQIGAELGDASIGIRVRAEIDELIGPNGENLETGQVVIAARLADESLANMENSKALMDQQLQDMGVLNTEGNRTGSIIAAGVASAGVGALLGAQIGGAIGAIGGPLAAVTAGAGAAVGAVVGGIAGAVIQMNLVAESAKKAGALAGAFVADMSIALQKQSEIRAVLDEYYDKKLKEAEAEGDITEYKRLQLEYDTKKNDLATQNQRITTGIVETYNNMVDEGNTAGAEAVMSGLKNAAGIRYAEDENYALYQQSTDLALADAVKSGKITGGDEALLRTQLLGPMDPATLAAVTGTGDLSTTVKIITEFSGETAADTGKIMNMLDDKDLALNFQLAVSKAPTQADADRLLELGMDVAALGGVLEGNVTTILNTVLKNPAEQEKINKLIADLAATEVQTIEQAYAIVPEFETGGKWEDAFNEEYFNALKNTVQKETYIETSRLIMSMPEAELIASDDFKKWLADEGAKYGPFPGNTHSLAKWQALYADSEAQKVTETGANLTGAVLPPKTKPKGGGGGEDPYKTLLTDLKNVRQNAVNAAGGIKELVKWLGKGKDINVFKGTQNALIKTGTTSEFQEFVMGLDKLEQQKLFSINKGMAKLTEEGRAVQKAFNKISLGNFVVEQQQAIKDSQNQRKAVDRLVKSGMTLAQAYRAVGDAAFAAAVASGKMTKKKQQEINNMIRLQQKAEAMSVYRMDADQLGSLLKESIQTQIDRLELDFELAIAVDAAIIADAQAQISALNFTLDDYQAGLQEITWQEQEINDRYQEQYDALQKVKDASSEIAQQEKGRLTLADALSQGDIAAAARAAQDLRQSQAEKALSNQDKSLKLAQEAELAALQDSNGRNRKQLEDLILGVQKQIFDIEENTLEPAQRRVEVLEIEKNKRVEVLNLQLRYYDDLVLKTVEAEQKTQAYIDKLNVALGLLKQMSEISYGPGPGASVAPVSPDGKGPGVPGPRNTGDPDPGKTLTDEERRQRQIAKDQKNSKAAFDKSGLSVSQFIRQQDAAAAAAAAKKAAAAAAKAAKNAAAANAKKGTGSPTFKASGGEIMSFMSNGGSPLGSDTVPAMLTPGEFVIRRPMVNKFGTKFFENLNNGTFPGLGKPMFGPKFNVPRTKEISRKESADSATLMTNPVYNNMYTVNVNVRSESNPDTIARAVISQIRQIDSRQLRGNRF
jgi:TP901 family phage tail tape measure protein